MKITSALTKEKDYSKYPFMDFSPESMEGEEWKDLPQFDGYYSVSNYGRVWAASRPINTIDGKIYYIKEGIRKQSLSKFYNSYTNEYTEQLSINLSYERRKHGLKVSRLVYELFIGPVDFKIDGLLIVHKDGDNCNNRYDNLVAMNGTELYGHGIKVKGIPRSGLKIKRGERLTSESNAPRPVVQYSLDGVLLHEYDSVQHAAQANNVHRGSIRAVALQKLVQLHGLVYRFKGSPYHGEHAGFSTGKIVTQYHLNGKKIKTFPTLKAAGIQTGIDSDTIGKCAQRKSMTGGGFVWRYDGDSYNGEYKDKIKNKPKTITQYSLDGANIASFVSVNEAARITGFSPATLLDCASKKTKVAHGFVWRFGKDVYSGEYRNYHKGKPVTRYTLNGDKIDTFRTIAAAALATGLTSDNIQKNVSGYNRTAGGFVWVFANFEDVVELQTEPLKPHKNAGKGKEVVQYSLEGKKLAVYASMTEAAKSCGINISGISAVLNRPNRAAGGFVWRTKGNIYRGSLAKAPPANKAYKVTQYDLSGRKLHVYKSTREAASATGAASSTISLVVRGKLKSTGGFIWQLGDGPPLIDMDQYYASTKEKVKAVSKSVLKYSLEGEFLKEYPSISEAARQEGIAMSRISAVINGQSKSAGGDFWKLKAD